MDNPKNITGPVTNMAIQEALTRRALCTNHHIKAPPSPKPLLGVTATKSAVSIGEPGNNPPAPPENSPPENASIRGKWIEEYKVYKYGFQNF
jgi:hypothetical protein